LPPGATIGILGNGQLGRMLSLAAARLGYRTHVYGPEKDSPAEQVATTATVAAYTDETALAAFAAAVDVITFEFENVPAATAELLSRRKSVRPSPRALETAQDRIAEKTFFALIGAATPQWRPISSAAALAKTCASFPLPAVLKTTRFGYDGKGQTKIAAAKDAGAAWQALGGGNSSEAHSYAVLEEFVDFACEISVIAARGSDGAVVCFEAAENVHAHHILATTTVPARIAASLAVEAAAIAKRAVAALDIVGLLAIEMFVTKDGRLLCNEMAPRPHNSGHWTMDAGGCDQFEMLVRAIADLPLVQPHRIADVTMVNLIGDDVAKIEGYAADPDARIHLYGKREARPRRKMGHVNLVKPGRS
jgi:5-(carboxyamino)imidazole ribonucleotide synthase